MRHTTGTDFFVALVTLLLAVPTLAGAQNAAAAGAPEKTLAPGMAAVARYAEKLEVPHKGKASTSMQVEFSNWTTLNRTRETTIPPQGFYIATLVNGTAVTVINGEEKVRHAGEMWAVQDGQSMSVKITDKKQENVGLEIVSIRGGH